MPETANEDNPKQSIWVRPLPFRGLDLAYGFYMLSALVIGLQINFDPAMNGSLIDGMMVLSIAGICFLGIRLRWGWTIPIILTLASLISIPAMTG